MAYCTYCECQIIIIIPIGAIEQAAMPEHGFLGGKKFQFYPTIAKYDFSGRKMRVELRDVRDSAMLKHVDCSQIEINNQSEFAGKLGTDAVYEYFQNLFPQSGIEIDTSAVDTLKVELEALDARLLGFGSITAHGLCQMKIRNKKFSKTYCIDITDKDKNSPLGRNAFVTRKTATRIITSASIREVLEQFLFDLKSQAL